MQRCGNAERRPRGAGRGGRNPVRGTAAHESRSIAAAGAVGPGEPLAEEKIAADLRRIYGRGDYESVGYRIAEENGKRILLIQPREKTWGPDYLRVGVGFSTDFRGLNPFNILASYRKTWINASVPSG